MANLRAMNSVGAAIVRYLTQSYGEARKPTDPDVTFQQIATGTLTGDINIDKTVTLLLYRITSSEHLRQHVRPGSARPAVAVDLHYLLTAWAKDAAQEPFMMSWTLAQLHRRPVLDRSLLPKEAGWADDDRIDISPSNLNQEELTRIWDRLQPNYRLSIAYTARVLQIDLDEPDESKPVVVRRFDYESMERSRS